MQRRVFVGAGAAFLASGAGLARPRVREGSRLTARPHAPRGTVRSGLTRLDAAGHDAMLLVPDGYDAGRQYPLMLALHGAGGSHQGPMRHLTPHANRLGFLVLALDSVGSTWDAIAGRYGPDVANIDAALAAAFDRAAVDPARIVIEGFSDGASYALGLGRGNGDLFARIVAFSPGFIPLPDPGLIGRPEVFITHGTRDAVLNIDLTSRRIVPALRRDGYQVNYVEFDGGHEMPGDVTAAALRWAVRS